MVICQKWGNPIRAQVSACCTTLYDFYQLLRTSKVYTHSKKFLQMFSYNGKYFHRPWTDKHCWGFSQYGRVQGGISTGNQQILFNRAVLERDHYLNWTKQIFWQRILVIIGPRTSLTQCCQVIFVDNSANTIFQDSSWLLWTLILRCMARKMYRRVMWGDAPSFRPISRMAPN